MTPAMLVPGLADRFPSFADMPPVLATAMLVGFAEAACLALIAPHLEPGEHSVGIHIALSHSAPTAAGATLRAEVTLEEVAGRILGFRLRLADGAGPVGEGSHRRAVILTDRFAHRVAERVAAARG